MRQTLGLWNADMGSGVLGVAAAATTGAVGVLGWYANSRVLGPVPVVKACCVMVSVLGGT